MRIEGNNEVARSAKLQAAAQTREPAKAESDAVDLSRGSKLETSLSASPEVRTEEVSRAKALITDDSYPSAEVINHVAKVMAEGIRRPK
jgi:flagellar hook-length control protein FliK